MNSHIIQCSESDIIWHIKQMLIMNNGEVILSNGTFNNANFGGTVLSSEDKHRIGMYLDTWKKEEAKIFLGIITLSVSAQIYGFWKIK